MKQIAFSKRNVGCWADGACGCLHVRTILAELIGVATWTTGRPNERIGDLQAALRAPASDDAAEEAEALEILQSVTDDGLIWAIIDGDLILLPDSELD